MPSGHWLFCAFFDVVFCDSDVPPLASTILFFVVFVLCPLPSPIVVPIVHLMLACIAKEMTFVSTAFSLRLRRMVEQLPRGCDGRRVGWLLPLPQSCGWNRTHDARSRGSHQIPSVFARSRRSRVGCQALVPVASTTHAHHQVSFPYSFTSRMWCSRRWWGIGKETPVGSMLPLGMGWIPPSHHNHGPLSPFSFLPFTFLPFSDGGRIFRGRVVPGILDRTPPSFLEHPPIDPSSMGHHNRRVGQRRSIAHGDNPKDRRRDPSAKEPNHTKRSTRRKVGIRKEKKQLRCRRVVVVHSEIRAGRQARASSKPDEDRPKIHGTNEVETNVA